VKKFVNIIEELGSLGNYERFSEDTFAEALEFFRDEKED
jgi:hypothetical protein